MRNVKWMLSVVMVFVLGFWTAPVWSDPMTPAQATYAYEGNFIPDGTTYPTMTTGGTAPTVSLVNGGNVLSADFPPNYSPDGNYYVRAGVDSSGWTVTGATWTVDFSAARQVPPDSWGNTNNSPAHIDVLVNGPGNGGRFQLILGKDGYKGMGDGGTTNSIDDRSMLTIWSDYTGLETEVLVPGLNINDMHNYRMVGTGGGTVKVYVDDIPTAVFTTVTHGSPGASWLSFGASYSSANSQCAETVLLDFIRGNSTTAYDVAPGAVPEPITLVLLGLGGLMLRRRA